jgi:hypothetical protein
LLWNSGRRIRSGLAIVCNGSAARSGAENRQILDLVMPTFRASIVIAATLVATAAFGLAAVSPPTRSLALVAQASLAQEARVSDRLYFGRLYPGGVVSEEQWAAFLADVVTPRFPQGLTVWAADGQWRDAALRINREPTFVLELVHAPRLDADAALKDIVAEYRRRFAQESVLWVRDRVDVID